jgi:hypothetical protein
MMQALAASVTRQVPRRHRAGGCGAHVGQVAVVEQQRHDLPGARRQQNHQA